MHRAPLAAVIVVASLVALPLAAHAEAAEDRAVQKTLKTLVTAIRYSKDDTAARQLALPKMAESLLGSAWAQITPAEQKQAIADLDAVMRKISFAKGREIFQYLDAVLYQPVTLAGAEAHCKSTVVIHRDLKKAELPIEWVLVKDGGQWKVADTITMGESTAAGIRQDQVEPLLKEGGTAKVLAALHEKAGAKP